MSLLALISIFFSQWAFAAPPGSQYNPWETADPGCAQWDANCDVNIAQSLSGATDTDLTGSATGSTLYFDGSQWIEDGNTVDLSALGGWTSTLSWATDTNLTGSATGSLLYNDGSQWIDLDLGSQSQILTSSGGQLLWSTPDAMSFTLSWATDTNLTAQGTGSILYYDGTEWIDLDLGTQDQVLTSSGGTLQS